MTPELTTLSIDHLVYDPQKRQAMLKGTRFSVAFLASFLDDPDWTAERIADEYGLTPAQIHAAWSYYYNHQAEIEAILQRDAEKSQTLGVALSSYLSNKWNT